MRRSKSLLSVTTLVWLAASAALAQQEAFRGSPVLSFYDRGIIAVPLTTSDGRESLKVTGSYDEIIGLVRGAPPAAASARQAHFEWRIGPDQVGPYGRCDHLSSEIADLEKCFDGRPIQSTNQHVETVEVDRSGQRMEFRTFVSRHKTIKALYATCGMHAPTQTKLSCDVFFEHGGLRHAASAGWSMLDQLPQFRCLVLLGRTKIWPGGPPIADACS